YCATSVPTVFGSESSSSPETMSSVFTCTSSARSRSPPSSTTTRPASVSFFASASRYGGAAEPTTWSFAAATSPLAWLGAAGPAGWGGRDGWEGDPRERDERERNEEEGADRFHRALGRASVLFVTNVRNDSRFARQNTLESELFLRRLEHDHGRAVLDAREEL